MTFSRDEQLMQLELDRAILYGESCMLEYDIQVAKLQESGLLTESSLESLQYLLEAAASESGFGGAVESIKKLFKSFIERFFSKDGRSRAELNKNVKRLEQAVAAGVVETPDDMMVFPYDAIVQAEKENIEIIKTIGPKLQDGTASTAELDRLNKAIEMVNKCSGVKASENEDLTKKYQQALVDHGIEIPDKAKEISDRVEDTVSEVTKAAPSHLKSGFKINGKSNESAVRRVGNTVVTDDKHKRDKTGAEIGHDAATHVVKNGLGAGTSDPDGLKKEIAELEKTKIPNAKTDLEDAKNQRNGKVQSQIPEYEKKVEKLENDLRKKKNQLSQGTKTTGDVRREEFDKQYDDLKSSGATNANLKAYQEAFEKYLHYCQLFAALEAKYAIESEKNIATLANSKTGKTEALDEMEAEVMGVIENSIREVTAKRDAETKGDDKWDYFDTRLKALEKHRDKMELVFSNKGGSTEEKYRAIEAAKAEAKKALDDARNNAKLSARDPSVVTDADREAKKKNGNFISRGISKFKNAVTGKVSDAAGSVKNAVGDRVNAIKRGQNVDDVKKARETQQRRKENKREGDGRDDISNW